MAVQKTGKAVQKTGIAVQKTGIAVQETINKLLNRVYKIKV